MTLTVEKASQEPLVFSGRRIVFGSTAALSATGGSGSGSISFAVVSGTCTISGTTLSSSSAQTCTVRATRSGGSNYLDVSLNANFVIEKAPQVITFNAIANRSFSTTPFAITAPTSDSSATPT
jgi:hypothetical protein